MAGVGWTRWRVLAVGPALRLLMTLVLTSSALGLATSPAQAAGDFPPGSMAVGHPALESEDATSGGVVSSRVPSASRVDADELLVRFAPAARSRLLHRMRAEPGLRLVGAVTKLPVEAVRTSPRGRARLMAWLRRQPGVVSVQRDAVETASAISCPTACTVPDDPGFAYQWYLYNAPGIIQPPKAGAPIFGADVDAPHAWSVTHGSKGVRIAVIDTGIDAGHPDLAGKVVAAANFTASTTTQDLAGHGTHVAGIAAASFDNAAGIAGVAPDADLMDVKVLAVDQTGRTSGDCADVADGIVWATDHGANVLNLSLGSRGSCQAMALAVDYASTHGALVVAAAGNDATTTRFYPAALPNVLSVAATTTRDEMASFSNHGASWVDVAAPGDEIVSTLPTFDNATGAVGYGYLSGTSMAAPVVSGIAALIWGQMPAATAARDVEARLIATAQPTPGTGTQWRYGRVDACLAASPSATSCGSQPAEPKPAPVPPAPPPPQTAQPAPIAAQPPASPRPPALPGAYRGALGRRGGPLRVTVADGGNALVGIQATVLLSCTGNRRLRVRVGALSTTTYGRIKPDGAFGLRSGNVRVTLRRPQFQFTGRFATTRTRVSGTLRVTGRAKSGGRCDSRPVMWNARR